MSQPTLKAFVLCNEIADSPDAPGQKDLYGAGLKVIAVADEFPVKQSLWAYVELSDEKPLGTVQLALVRADSGRSHYFRAIPLTFANPLTNATLAVRLFNCVFPIPGVYFVELWYDNECLADQRLELVADLGD